MSRKIKTACIALGLLVTLTVIGAYSVNAWRKQVHLRQDLERLKRAEASLATAPQTALELFYLSRSQDYPAGTKTDWLRLQRDALIQQQAYFELVGIYQRVPEIILENELASIYAFRVLSEADYVDEAATILNSWKNREDRQENWLEAEAHALVNAGKSTDARELLASHAAPQTDSIEQLLLAAQVADTPQQRAEQLQKAAQIDSENLQLRLAQADYFESTNQPRLALYEYNRALELSPEDPRILNLSSSFLIRHRSSEQALRIWENAASHDVQSYIRTHVWRRLLRPLQVEAQPPKGGNASIKELVSFFQAIPEDRFFDESTFRDLSPTTPWESRLEGIYWLRVLDFLDQGQFDAAYTQLQRGAPSGLSYNAGISRALYLVLEYKLHGALDDSNARIPRSRGTTQAVLLESLERLMELTAQHAIAQTDFERLNKEFSSSEETSRPSDWQSRLDQQRQQLVAIEAQLQDASMNECKQLLNSELLMPAIFLAGGWPEAALRLAGPNQPSSNDAEWLKLLWADALRQNRSPAAAVTYLQDLQAPTPNETLLKAEILLQLGDGPAARKIADSYREELSNHGSRATSIAAKEAMRRGAYNEAIRLILANRDYSLSVPGHELVARIYLLAGDLDRASDVLKRIEPHSTFAQEFLAARYFKQGHLDEAKANVLQLLTQMPERTDLRASLLQIVQAQQEQKVHVQ